MIVPDAGDPAQPHADVEERLAGACCTKELNALCDTLINIPTSDACSHAAETTPDCQLLDLAGVEQLQKDVDTLLDMYVKKKDVVEFLSSLPLYSHASSKQLTLSSVNTAYEQAVNNLLYDEVNSTAAMKVRPYVGDCVVYPVVVLLEALGRATAIPVVFYIDILLSVMSSALNKHAFVKLLRFQSRSRHWMNGTANVGEGKSAGMRDMFNLMIDAMEEHPTFTVGTSNDRFQYQQSGTTAGAINKLRACDGNLTIYCSDAGRCLADATAQGKKADPSQFDDL